ncbi:DUF3949 domain-containing protein [Bacillus sp. BRMEA1]|uniref:DUF3949 domain-containing protein n=1 Tax=Neobacillus endophyticus TaxID=2738405 RepID=UPI001563E7B8|nr:DUF3949 domain-containing protein [Neobacillus endophyticus]NRD77081.1 DUF3949 domain-containing protein [Neobacillus endophyticus]
MLLGVFFSIVLLYILLSFILLPFQYRFLVALKQQEKVNRLKGLGQGDMYDRMSASELELQYNVQSNALFLLANLMASILYRMKHSARK